MIISRVSMAALVEALKTPDEAHSAFCVGPPVSMSPDIARALMAEIMTGGVHSLHGLLETMRWFTEQHIFDLGVRGSQNGPIVREMFIALESVLFAMFKEFGRVNQTTPLRLVDESEPS